MRARHELEAEYATAAREHGALVAENARDFLDRARAVVEALGWVLGERPAPITGTPPTGEMTNVVAGREEDLALDVLYRRADHGINFSYASGVEHALLWARGGTDEPPVSTR